MSREVRSILGYSAQDVVRLTEATSEDLVAAYREVITAAKSGCCFEDIVDGLLLFLDAAADVDPDGVFDDKLAAFLRDKVMSDEFKDMARSVFALMGENRTYAGSVAMSESLDDFDGLLDAAAKEVKIARDFTEASLAISTMISSVRARSPEAAAVVDRNLIEALEALLVQLQGPLRKLAARMA